MVEQSTSARTNRHHAWSRQDDERLINARETRMNWQQVSRLFRGKSDNACRKRHERLIAKRGNNGWSPEHSAIFTTSYNARREAMWTPMAEELDMTWEQLERRVCLRGFSELLLALPPSVSQTTPPPDDGMTERDSTSDSEMTDPSPTSEPGPSTDPATWSNQLPPLAPAGQMEPGRHPALPVYQPPVSSRPPSRGIEGRQPMRRSPSTESQAQVQTQRSVSIQSMLSPNEGDMTPQ